MFIISDSSQHLTYALAPVLAVPPDQRLPWRGKVVSDGLRGLVITSTELVISISAYYPNDVHCPDAHIKYLHSINSSLSPCNSKLHVKIKNKNSVPHVAVTDLCRLSWHLVLAGQWNFNGARLTDITAFDLPNILGKHAPQ
jgi:hypothetical protein